MPSASHALIWELLPNEDGRTVGPEWTFHELTVAKKAGCEKRQEYLVQVHPNSGSDRDPADGTGSTIPNIIAVHGLGTESPGTWIAQDGTTGETVNWLSDKEMLPKIIPSARIWTFNYDSQWLSNAPVTRLILVAETLLTILQDKLLPKDCEARGPLMFVASSFGGLVVAQTVEALERANQAVGPWKDLLLSTIGIIFLGSPLRGTPHAGAAQWIATIAGMLGHEPSSSLIEDLDGKSAVLDDLLYRFSLMANEDWLRLQVRCFFELHKTQVINSLSKGPLQNTWLSSSTMVQVVDEKSACIDGFPKWGLETSHMKMNKYLGPEDKGFELVSGRLKELVHKAPGVLRARLNRPRPISFLPFPRNKDLVFRETIFYDLNKKLPLVSRYQTAALWGLGGSGKTQIALEYAYRRQNERACAVCWVHAGTSARFTQDYAKIARLAGVPVELKGDDLLHTVRLWFEEQSEYLLILDNADLLDLFKKRADRLVPEDNSSDFLQFVPHGSTGTVLWTSRDSSIMGRLVGVGDGIEVTQMEEPEALELLRTRRGTIEGKELAATAEESELLNHLDKIPLAIAQAAAFMRRTGESAKAYVEKLKDAEKARKRLEREFDDLHRESKVPNSVTGTWRISMKQIEMENPCAARIMYIIAFFDNQGVPFELVQEAAGPGIDDDDALEAVTRLTEFSFLQLRITEADNLRKYDMHRLVQTATQQSTAIAAQVNTEPPFSKIALDIMKKMYPNGTYETWDRSESYLPHALKVTSWQQTQEYKVSIAIVLSNISMYLFMQNRSKEKERVDEKAVELRKEVLGEKHPGTLHSMANLAATYWQQGRSTAAEEIDIRVLELRKEVLGEKHPDTLHSMASLASTYHQQGRSTAAEEIKIRVLELRKEVLGEKHPDTLGSMANLASTYHQQGRSTTAEEIRIRVLELRKEVLGEKHPDTLHSMASLASTYYQQGRSTAAEEIEIRVLELRKEVLGEKHPDTLHSMASLAATYYQQGRSTAAEEIEIRVLELRKEVLGEKHPDTLHSMANLASTYYQQGRSTMAEEINIRVLELRKEVLGEKHPDTLDSMANLASTYHQQGRSTAAEEIKIRVLELRKEVLGEKHPDTLDSMANLASTYQQQGRSTAAEEINIRVLELRKEVLGEKHPDTLYSMANLASTYHQQGRSTAAEEIKIRVLELRKEVLGEKHPDTLRSMANLAATYWQQGRSTAAEEINIRVLELRKEVLGEKHPDTLQSIKDLAAIQEACNDTDDSELSID